MWYIQFSSVAQSCPTLWDPMNRSTSGLPVYHQLPEFTQTHVHRVSDAISHFILCRLLLLLPQSLQASGSFPMSQLFAWGGPSIGVSASASILPMNTQDWPPLGWTGWISLQSRGLTRVFSSTQFCTFSNILLLPTASVPTAPSSEVSGPHCQCCQIGSAKQTCWWQRCVWARLEERQ